MNKALFLDRDGVINIDKGYVHKPEDCEFVDGIFELVKRANDLNYKVIIVTNQAGIARGYYTEDQFKSFSEWMQQKFQERNSKIDHIYYCPHHPESGLGKYLARCECRKPRPGMFMQAKIDFNLEMESSLMIGDNITDLQAAKSASVGELYLFNDYPKEGIGNLQLDIPYRKLANFSDIKLL
ncbi:D-glycero-beta-D-manno-heptose 1,7-bisphosphate 7-phosphatase [Methylophilus sp. TWE2]|uniref:D-glycero-beta-D-manno-heptose 1,7-bisphosphate 7-phosphatase n=1 Tax=Methylophilus sp. TWE2 TaxID=1662285 RepID=UPI00067088AB|nr:D-glycero-beta-D-manno-heptose 1,7-bisphosphate 7-phosphatase [Methylophilus sp. TWE2]AKR43376.1 D,D-heptose 1,7-bisphosphate phosphatase [Methylophilus sp. TWE2]